MESRASELCRSCWILSPTVPRGRQRTAINRTVQFFNLRNQDQTLSVRSSISSSKTVLLRAVVPGIILGTIVGAGFIMIEGHFSKPLFGLS